MGNGQHQQAAHHLIAVIDDDQSVRSSLDNLLHSVDYRICSFDSAEAFLASESLLTVSCAIIDVSLNTMTGFKLKEHLNSLHIALPTIFISGQVSRTAQEQAARLGAIALLRKPINAETLLSHIKRLTLASGEAE